MSISAEIRGLKETQKGVTRIAQGLRGSPMLQAMRDATMIITAEAKRNAPVDTGRLRASIIPEVRQGNPIEGVVGSNVEYAPYQELGTKFMKGKFYLRRAFEENIQRIKTIFDRAVGSIINGR
jgi:HK97 gp10 family phage protein